MHSPLKTFARHHEFHETRRDEDDGDQDLKDPKRGVHHGSTLTTMDTVVNMTNVYKMKWAIHKENAHAQFHRSSVR